MCGRTACALAPAVLQKVCSYKDSKTNKYKKPKWRGHPKVKNGKLDPKYYPSYNIFPTRFTPILFKDKKSNKIVLQPALWKLIPPWHKGEATSHVWSTFNCRIEGLDSSTPSKMFRPALVRRRCCAIPIQGFYEWKMVRGQDGRQYKQPYFICMAQKKKKSGLDEIVHKKSWKQGKWNKIRGWKGPKMMFLAGLYNVWKGPLGELVYSYTIITQPSNKKLSAIHRRMPVILRREQLMAWLDPKEGKSDEDMVKLLRKKSPNVTPYPVSSRVNDARCNNEGCIRQIGLKRKGSKGQDEQVDTKRPRYK